MHFSVLADLYRCVILQNELIFQPVAEVQIAPQASATGIPSEPYGAKLHQRNLTDSIAGSDAILLPFHTTRKDPCSRGSVFSLQKLIL